MPKLDSQKKRYERTSSLGRQWGGLDDYAPLASGTLFMGPERKALPY
jgi:hypothetical protein